MIKVMIERKIAEGMESTYEHTIKNTLKAILEAPGYLSGESFRDAHNPNHRILFTTWSSVEAWQAWAKSAERANVIGAIQPILEEQEKITILVTG